MILQRNELVDAVLGGHEKMRGAKPTDLAVAANLEGAGDNEHQVIIGVLVEQVAVASFDEIHRFDEDVIVHRTLRNGPTRPGLPFAAVQSAGRCDPGDGALIASP